MCIFFVNKYQKIRPLFGDIGSGYWIGVEVLQAVARSRDGLGPKTVLDKYLQEYVGSGVELLSWVYETKEGDSMDTTWKRFADLSPLAFKAYEDSDEGKLNNFYILHFVKYLFEKIYSRPITL